MTVRVIGPTLCVDGSTVKLRTDERMLYITSPVNGLVTAWLTPNVACQPKDIFVCVAELSVNSVGLVRGVTTAHSYCAGPASDALARPGTTGGPGEWIGSSSAHGVRHVIRCSYRRRVAAIWRALACIPARFAASRTPR